MSKVSLLFREAVAGTVLLLSAATARAQEITIGATGSAAQSLGYSPAAAALVRAEGTRWWETFQVGPLAKTTVKGGADFNSVTEAGLFCRNEACLTAAVFADRMVNSVWTKTTMGAGPGVHASSGKYELWAFIERDFIGPNGGEMLQFGVQRRLGSHLALETGGTLNVYNQPFTTPIQRDRFGSSSYGGVEFRFGNVRKASP